MKRSRASTAPADTPPRAAPKQPHPDKDVVAAAAAAAASHRAAAVAAASLRAAAAAPPPTVPTQTTAGVAAVPEARSTAAARTMQRSFTAPAAAAAPGGRTPSRLGPPLRVPVTPVTPGESPRRLRAWNPNTRAPQVSPSSACRAPESTNIVPWDPCPHYLHDPPPPPHLPSLPADRPFHV